MCVCVCECVWGCIPVNSRFALVWLKKKRNNDLRKNSLFFLSYRDYLQRN